MKQNSKSLYCYFTQAVCFLQNGNSSCNRLLHNVHYCYCSLGHYISSTFFCLQIILDHYSANGIVNHTEMQFKILLILTSTEPSINQLIIFLLMTSEPPCTVFISELVTGWLQEPVQGDNYFFISPVFFFIIYKMSCCLINTSDYYMRSEVEFS